MMKFLKQVVTNNTGVSSKSFVMVSGMLLAAEVTQVMLVLTILDFIKSNELNYTGISLLLGALATFVLGSAWGKVKSEEYEYYPEEPTDKSPSLNKEDGVG